MVQFFTKSFALYFDQMREIDLKFLYTFYRFFTTSANIFNSNRNVPTNTFTHHRLNILNLVTIFLKSDNDAEIALLGRAPCIAARSWFIDCTTERTEADDLPNLSIKDITASFLLYLLVSLKFF